MNTNDSFSCFYHLVDSQELDQIWKDEKTLFIFDTNVLLSLYSFQSESRRDFFKVLDSIKDRIWIPFHVALEFQKNRLSIIKNRRKTFSDLNSEINKLRDTIKFEKKPFTTIQTDFSLKKNYPDVFSKLTENFEKINEKYTELEKDFSNLLKEVLTEVSNYDTDKIYVNSPDFIREELSKLFNDERVGLNIFDSQEKLNELYSEGELRYKNKIPPGYKDESKGDEEFFFDNLSYKRKFGDLIIFKQIIEFSKEKAIKNVIFISEDIKEDWRHIEEQNGDKILGARPELKKELYKKSGVDQFLVYQIQDFMKNTKEYLNIQIEEKTLIDIKTSLDEEKYKKKIEDKIKNNIYLNLKDHIDPIDTDPNDFIILNNNYCDLVEMENNVKYENNIKILDDNDHYVLHISEENKRLHELKEHSEREKEYERYLMNIRERKHFQELEEKRQRERELMRMRERKHFQELEGKRQRERELMRMREQKRLQELENNINNNRGKNSLDD